LIRSSVLPESWPSDAALVQRSALRSYRGPLSPKQRQPPGHPDRIDRDGGAQRDNLLAVAQVFARLHFDKPEWLEILGGQKAMIESPLIQEIVQESQRTGRVKTIVRFLQARFGAVPPAILAGLEQVKADEKLELLTDQAATCGSLPAFEEALRKELPAPPPASTRGKRKARKPHTEGQP
jgi:hypothetical protein